MKKVILILAGLLTAAPAFSQSTFNKIYDFDNRWEVGRALLEVNEDIYVIQYSSVLPDGSSNRFIFKYLDEKGSVMDSFYYKEPDSRIIMEGMLKTENEKFIAWGLKHHAGESFHYIIKFTPQFDTLWTRSFQLGSGNEGCKKVIQTHDGGFAMNGFSQVYDNQGSQIYAIKLDSQGIKEWEFIYSDTLLNEGGNDILQLDDSSFILLNSRSSPGSSRNVLLVKLDKNGNYLWEKEHFSSYFTHTEVLIPSGNGNFLVGGVQHTSGGFGAPRRAYAMMVDSLGEVIWEKRFGGTTSGRFYSGYKQNNHFILTGVTSGNLTDDHLRGYLAKVDLQGNLVWERVLTPSGQVDYESEDYIYNVIPTSDGGILTAGFTFKGMFSNTQDAWFMKLDSLGQCDTASCFPWLLDTGIGERYPSHPGVKVYPNPAKDVVNIGLEFGHGRYEVYDYTGRQVSAGELVYGENTVNSSGFAPGVYLIRIFDNNKPVDVRRVVIVR